MTDRILVADDAFSYIRLRLKLTAHGDADWRLVLRDDWSRPLQILSKSSFQDGSALWTNRFRKTGKIGLELLILSKGTGPAIDMDQYLLMPNSSQSLSFYSRMSHPWKELNEADRDWSREATSVGMVVGGRGTKSWCCSGAVIATQPKVLFLTNFHCGSPVTSDDDDARWTKGVCDSTIVDFSWDGDDVPIEFGCHAIAKLDPAADIAVLELKPLGNHSSPPPLPIKKRFNGDPVTLIHHPECATKKISEVCAVSATGVKGWRKDSGAIDFTHTCDTERGSSGAPALDQDGNLVGLHHLGFRFKMRDNGETYCDKQNSGIMIDGILNHLESIKGAKGSLRVVD